MHILIVDDDALLLEALADFLRLKDHEVDVADNAMAAVEMVKAQRYDFVLVDYRMQGKDGIWFMKNAKLPRKTKALLMTAYVDREVIRKMFALGAVGYVIKPFDDEEILRNLSFYSP